MSFGIIGNGFVGKATQLLKSNKHTMKIYDIDPEKCSPPNITLSDLEDCHIIFVAVPTPSNPDGSCHLEIVRSVIENIRALNIRAHIVIRSTVVIGTSDELDCYFMPEFLTEKTGPTTSINVATGFSVCEKVIMKRIKTLFVL